MEQPLVLYRCGWTATPTSETTHSLHHPPVPNILQYWCTGYGDGFDNLVGIVAAPPGTDPMDFVRQEFLNVQDRGMTTLYDLTADKSDRFATSVGDWDMQRLAYFAATGQLYDNPIVGHYERHDGPSWWCTTTIEILD